MKIQAIQTIHALALAGFSPSEIKALFSISRTLQRWHELECGTERNGVTLSIERDEVTEKPFLRRQFRTAQGWQDIKSPTRDLDKAARKKLATIMEGKACTAYVQSDPRGCPLYILRPGETANSYYCGIAVTA